MTREELLEPLDQKEEETLQAIREYITEFKRPPTFKNLSMKLKLRSRSSAKKRTDILVEKGWLKRLPGARGIDLVDSPIGISIPVLNLRWMKERPRT